MIGQTLVGYLRACGHQVIPLIRYAGEGIVWDIDAGMIQQDKLEGRDVIIHLAGADISQYWTHEYKKIIESSRVQSTRLLVQSLIKLNRKPSLLISASAVGYYGHGTSGVVVDETSPQGRGFLPQVCGRWEEETRAAIDVGIRTVNLRFGMVLGKKGGVLARMLPVFKWGLGSVLGSGKQMISWVALNEIPHIIDHIICREDVSGPVNAVSPQAVSNREFTRILAKAIGRKAFLTIPEFAVRLLFGQMGQHLLLEGNFVDPARLNACGYVFRYPDLYLALQEIINS